MSQKLCKNKKCQRPLPEGYKYKYCEHCRSERAQQIKRAGKAALGVVVMVGGTAVTVLTKGKINPTRNKPLFIMKAILDKQEQEEVD